MSGTTYAVGFRHCVKLPLYKQDGSTGTEQDTMITWLKWGISCIKIQGFKVLCNQVKLPQNSTGLSHEWIPTGLISMSMSKWIHLENSTQKNKGYMTADNSKDKCRKAEPSVWGVFTESASALLYMQSQLTPSNTKNYLSPPSQHPALLKYTSLLAFWRISTEVIASKDSLASSTGILVIDRHLSSIQNLLLVTYVSPIAARWEKQTLPAGLFDNKQF